MVNYYDGLIGGIGALLLMGAVLAHLTGPVALVVCAGLAATLVGHGLFARPPTDGQEEKTESSRGPAPVGD